MYEIWQSENPAALKCKEQKTKIWETDDTQRKVKHFHETTSSKNAIGFIFNSYENKTKNPYTKGENLNRGQGVWKQDL